MSFLRNLINIARMLEKVGALLVFSFRLPVIPEHGCCLHDFA